MSVVYGIVTRHGGSIDVRTALGEGTTFRLEFPAAAEPVVIAGTDGAALPQLVRPGRILIIDDEPEIAEILKEILGTEGHTVATAVNGTNGVKMAAVASYDLVITDLGMPDISGWEVARQIRDRSPELPVMLVTGWGATLDEHEIRKAGIADVVHKPFDIEQILTATARVLGTRAPEEDALARHTGSAAPS